MDRTVVSSEHRVAGGEQVARNRRSNGNPRDFLATKSHENAQKTSAPSAFKFPGFQISDYRWASVVQIFCTGDFHTKIAKSTKDADQVVLFAILASLL